MISREEKRSKGGSNSRHGGPQSFGRWREMEKEEMTGQRKPAMGHEIYLVPTGRLKFQRHQVSGKGRLGRHFYGLILAPAPHPQLHAQEPGVGVDETFHQKWGKKDRPAFGKMDDSPSSIHPHWVPRTLEPIRHPQQETGGFLGRYKITPEKRPSGADIWRLSTQLSSQLSTLPLKYMSQPGGRGPRGTTSRSCGNDRS